MFSLNAEVEKNRLKSKCAIELSGRSQTESSNILTHLNPVYMLCHITTVMALDPEEQYRCGKASVPNIVYQLLLTAGNGNKVATGDKLIGSIISLYHLWAQ